MAAVVPQQPAHAVKDGKGLVTRVLVELILTRMDDRITFVSFPVRNSVTGARNADLRVIRVAEPYVKHVIPITAAKNLSARYFVLFPNVAWFGPEDWIRGAFSPVKPVGA